MSGAEEQDLYGNVPLRISQQVPLWLNSLEVLNITSTASKAEIKKAYHKAALTSHPDKVPEDQREEADIQFKTISRAYEILSDDDTRALYDQHGMAAFEKGGADGLSLIHI